MVRVRCFGKCQTSGMLSGRRFLNWTLFVWGCSNGYGQNRNCAAGSIRTWIIQDRRQSDSDCSSFVGRCLWSLREGL